MGHVRQARRQRLRVLRAWALAGLVLSAPSAQATDPAPQAAVSVQELEALVETIEDEGKRAALVTQLRALIEARRAAAAPEPPLPESVGAQLLAALSSRMSAVSAQLAAGAQGMLDTPRLLEQFLLSSAGAQWRTNWPVVLLKIVAVLAAGWLAERLARLLLRRAMTRLQGRDTTSIWLKAPLLLARTLLDLVAIAVFALAAYGTLSVIALSDLTRLVALTLVNASVIARAILALARTALSPEAAGLRLLPVEDESAHYWLVWIRRLTNLGIYGYFIIEASLLLGVPVALHDVMLDLLALALTAMLVVVVQQNRTQVAAWIRGDGGVGSTIGPIRRRLAEIWHLLAIVYLIGVYAVWLMGLPGGFIFLVRASLLSLLILALTASLAYGLRRGLQRMFALGADTRAKYPGLEARANRYLPALRTALTGALYLIGVLAILQTWNVDALAWLTTDAARRAGASVISIVSIVVGAVVIWELVSALIERYLADSEGGAARSARLRTLLPLARKTFMVVLMVMVALTVLSEVGINIGPLLAGAGVVGLAIGFGAQTLVKDIITGVFILLEDSVAVGDFIEVGGRSGTVESMSIRSIRLRDPEGTVYTTPFSEVTSVLNYTKDFSYAVLDVGIAYRENVEEVMGVIREIGREMQEDPTLAPDIRNEIEVLGLQSLDDSAVVVRARIKTTPGKQWAMRRAFNLRMKRRFDELGIEIPFPHRTIYFGEDKAGKAPAAPVRLERQGG